MNSTFYTVIEVQEDAQGARGCIPVIYADYDAALAKYYTVLSVAVVSNLPYHSCHIIRSDGVVTDGRVFDRRVGE